MKQSLVCTALDYKVVWSLSYRASQKDKLNRTLIMLKAVGPQEHQLEDASLHVTVRWILSVFLVLQD